MKYNLKKNIVLPALTLLILLIGSSFRNDFFEIAKQIEIFTTVFKELNMSYVDEINTGDLMDSALKNMLKELDPYTVFMNEQDVETARINNTGDYTGIGASIKTLEDKLIVIEPYKGYPADVAGLKAGDEIIKIDNVLVSDFKQNTGDLLKGVEGSTVTLTYKRQGQINTAEVIRAEVAIKAVPLYKLLDNNIGYVALSKFNNKAALETQNAITNLKAEGADKLILDLRGNPGGYLNEAIKIVNFFIPKGELVVTTKSVVDNYNQTYFTKNEPLDTEIPLIILTDEGSASASEIVSGSLQDLDRAVIIGTRTFGKGLVQRTKPLNYGTQLKITISRYYTPSGRCIQALDYWNRDEKGNAIRATQDSYNAFKTKNGRTVYDGGGIQPDIELSETKHSNSTKNILKENHIFNYATQYYYNNSIQNLNDFRFTDQDFINFKSYLKSNSFTFETKTEKALEEAMQFAEEENFKGGLNASYSNLVQQLNTLKSQAIDNNKNQLTFLLEYEIVKRYFYREGMYEYILKKNKVVNKAKSIFSEQQKYLSYLNK